MILVITILLFAILGFLLGVYYFQSTWNCVALAALFALLSSLILSPFAGPKQNPEHRALKIAESISSIFLVVWLICYLLKI